MPPKPKLYTATIDGVEVTQSMIKWAKWRRFTTMSLRRNVKKADGDMQKALLTIGSRCPSLDRRQDL